jgi:hypothetical protein
MVSINGPDLSSILNSNGVPTEVIAYLQTVGCLSLKNFANWVDEAKELQSEVLEKVASHKTDRAALAALKQSWREVESIVARGVKRSAEGLPDVAQDEPLPHGIQDSIMDTFVKTYKFDLEPKRRPCDSLLGRVKREFDTSSPTMFPLHRVRSLAMTTRSTDHKKHRVGELEITDLADTEIFVEDGSERLRYMLHQLELLSVTWAMAGVTSVKVNGVDVPLCTWQAADRYYRHIREKVEPLTDRFTEDSVKNYLSKIETQLRGFAIELVRCRELPRTWGDALSLVLREHSYLWADNRDCLVRGSGPKPADRSPKPADRNPKPADRSPKPADRPLKPGSPAKGKMATASSTSNGTKLCKSFNDNRGCKPRCPHGLVHACDVVLVKSGAACGSKDHNRAKHDKARHGTPATY